LPRGVKRKWPRVCLTPAESVAEPGLAVRWPRSLLSESRGSQNGVGLVANLSLSPTAKAKARGARSVTLRL
jgi:hypothetical protein